MLGEQILHVFMVVLISYLLGSVPTAYLIAKTRNINIFEIGSGNMGGTNVVRAMGMRWGLVTAGLDICKGIVAVLVAREFIMPQAKGAATTISAIVVVIGHNWSLFATLLTARITQGQLRARIRGGKGAATAFGTMLMIAPLQIILAMLALGGFLVAVTRYVSLGVLVAFFLAIAWLAVLVSMNQLPSEVLVYALAVGALITYRFRENIHRLLTGTERRLGEPA